MSKKLALCALILFLASSCSREEIKIPEPQNQNEILTIQEINQIIDDSMEKTGDFIWSEQDIQVIWSALSHGENVLTIGYGETKESYERNAKSISLKDELLSLIQESEKTLSKTERLIDADEHINVMDVFVKSKQTLITLLNNPRIRYVEPSDYGFYEEELQQEEFQEREFRGFGCTVSAKALKKEDYRVILPNALVPWAFDAHKIPEAWEYSTGKGVTVAIVDTGISSSQELLNNEFNDGYSEGKTVERYVTYEEKEGVNDRCGHGTKMSSVATAPRNDNGLPLGVAYNANLIVYRATKDVWLNRYKEKKGVSKAFIQLANRNDVKIISMSLGKVFTNRRIRDAIRYAYKRGKLIFAAGGTTHKILRWIGVIFPAKMEETVAVTGVYEGSYERCDVCHKGKKIDFTIQMQRRSKSLVPVLNYYNNQTTYIGGSSVATAMTAGIAALIWEKYPTWTREQVLQRLKESSEFYPKRDKNFGYGNIDALKAVQ